MEKKTQNKPISFDIKSECAQTKQSIHIEIDSDLKFRVVNKDADIMIYLPIVDFAKLKKPSIIDDF